LSNPPSLSPPPKSLRSRTSVAPPHPHHHRPLLRGARRARGPLRGTAAPFHDPTPLPPLLRVMCLPLLLPLVGGLLTRWGAAHLFATPQLGRPRRPPPRPPDHSEGGIKATPCGGGGTLSPNAGFLLFFLLRSTLKALWSVFKSILERGEHRVSPCFPYGAQVGSYCIHPLVTIDNLPNTGCSEATPNTLSSGSSVAGYCRVVGDTHMCACSRGWMTPRCGYIIPRRGIAGWELPGASGSLSAVIGALLFPCRRGEVVFGMESQSHCSPGRLPFIRPAFHHSTHRRNHRLHAPCTPPRDVGRGRGPPAVGRGRPRVRSGPLPGPPLPLSSLIVTGRGRAGRRLAPWVCPPVPVVRLDIYAHTSRCFISLLNNLGGYVFTGGLLFFLTLFKHPQRGSPSQTQPVAIISTLSFPPPPPHSIGSVGGGISGHPWD